MLTRETSGRYLDTLARVRFAMGEKPQALEIEERAVRLLGDSAEPGYWKRLEAYRKAVAAKTP